MVIGNGGQIIRALSFYIIRRKQKNLINKLRKQREKTQKEEAENEVRDQERRKELIVSLYGLNDGLDMQSELQKKSVFN